MQSQTTSRKPIGIFIFFSILISIIVIDACRKLDYEQNKKENDTVIDRTKKFFTIPDNTDPRVQLIVELIKKQNDSFHFVNDVSGKIGFPVWNKALIASPNKGQSRITDSSDITYLYIPFDHDSVIDATLIVRTNAEDTVMHILNDWEYRNAGFDTATSEVWNAWNVFQLFSIFEKEVLGHESLVIKDYRLFPTADTINKLTVVKNKEDISARTNLMTFITRCNIYDVCTGPEEEEWCDGGCTTSCPYYTHTESFCFSLWVDDGWTGAIPPFIPWGGGGSYSPWYSNVCNTGTQCGTPGWDYWDPTNFQYNYIGQGYKHFETWDMSDADLERIDNWKNGNRIDTTGLDPCVRSILNKLLGGNNLIGRILAKIDNARPHRTDIENFKLIIRTGTPSIANSNAETKFGPFVGGVSVDTIIIRDSVGWRGSQLGIARVLLHEIIHAYMGSLFKRYFSGQYSLSQINSMGIDSIFDSYIDTLKSSHVRLHLQNWVNHSADFDHNFMAEKLMGMMAETLAFIDDNRNSDEYYWQLCWGGLFRTRIWQTYWPNYFSTPPANWPPTNPAPSDDSTHGLRYAFTTARIDSIWRHSYNELIDTAKAKGRKKIAGGCYGDDGGGIPLDRHR